MDAMGIHMRNVRKLTYFVQRMAIATSQGDWEAPLRRTHPVGPHIRDLPHVCSAYHVIWLNLVQVFQMTLGEFCDLTSGSDKQIGIDCISYCELYFSEFAAVACSIESTTCVLRDNSARNDCERLSRQ